MQSLNAVLSEYLFKISPILRLFFSLFFLRLFFPAAMEPVLFVQRPPTSKAINCLHFTLTN
jgi:hypothetical protein